MDGAVLLADASKYTGNKVVSDAGGGYGDFGLGLPQDDAIGVLASKNLGGAGTGASVGGQGLSFEDDVAARKAASDPFGLKAASVPASDAPTRYPGFMESPEPWPEPAPPLSDEAARANNPNYSNEGRNAPRPEAIGIELQSPSTNTPNDTSIVNGRAYKEHFGVVKDPTALVGEKTIDLNKNGRAECAELVKSEAGAPRTGNDGWHKGTQMTPESVLRIEAGTPVASGWDQRGFYPHDPTGQHSGIFAGPILDRDGSAIGFKIVEQYAKLKVIKEREVFFDAAPKDSSKDYFYKAGRYATIRY